MDVVIEVARFIIIAIIGLILIKWYENRSGWEIQPKTSITFTVVWRTIIFLIVLAINLISSQFSLNSNLILYYSFYPLIELGVTFFLNIILGVYFFRFIYKKKPQEFFVIILIIVIIDIIVENFLFYLILIQESLISNFNL